MNEHEINTQLAQIAETWKKQPIPAWRLPYRKTYEIVGYAYDADAHCVACATAQGMTDPQIEDSEGNPVTPIFLDQSDDMICGDCFARLDD